MSVFISGCGSETKLGYLDAERVMNEAPQIKTIRDNIDAKNKEEALDFVSSKAFEYGITDDKDGLLGDF